MILYCKKFGKKREEYILRKKLKEYFSPKHRFFKVVLLAKTFLKPTIPRKTNKFMKEKKRIQQIDMRRFERLHRLTQKTP